MLKYSLLILIPLYGLFSQVDTLDLLLVKGILPYNQLNKEVLLPEQLQQSLHGSLSDVLSHQTLLYVKDYGLGGSSTMAVRGLGSSNTSVFWKGLNINSLTLGLSDISLIQRTLWDKVTLYQSNNTVLLGSGANNGALLLENETYFNKENHYQISQTIGSFSNFQTDLKATISNPNWYLKSHLFYSSAQNNFRYLDLNSESKERTHNQTLNQGFYLNSGFKLGTQRLLNAYLWFQDAHKEIPNSILGSLDSASQRDQFLRINLTYQAQHNNWLSKFYWSASLDDLKYDNYSTSINSKFKTEHLLWGADVHFTPSKQHNFTGSLSTNFQKAYTNNYQQPVKRYFITPIITYTYTNKKFQANTQLRLEYHSQDRKMPFIPSLNLNYKASKHLQYNAVVARNFRRPTLNDLYWSPGGNPLLIPEDGLHTALGLELQQDSNVNTLSTTLFHDLLKHQIVWQPYGIYWQPFNTNRTNSLGWNVKHNLRLKVHQKYHLNWTNQYQYLRAIDPTTGYKLPYLPSHSVSSNWSLESKAFKLWMTNTYKSKRYITNDQNYSLNPYLTSNIGASYAFNYQSTRTTLTLTINNVFNTSYQTIAWYPMPLRYFLFNFNLEF